MRTRLSKDRVSNLPPAPSGAVRLTGLSGLADFAAKAAPELVGNAMVCAVNQAVYPLKRQIESQGRQFIQEGGFTENLYRRRRQARNAEQGGDARGTSDRSGNHGDA